MLVAKLFYTDQFYFCISTFLIVFELINLFKIFLPWVSITHGLSFLVANGDYTLITVHRLLTVVASLATEPEHGL